ncbi:hypothetical protein Agub_g12223, partial [Astrephomene gubernaculifera]
GWRVGSWVLGGVVADADGVGRGQELVVCLCARWSLVFQQDRKQPWEPLGAAAAGATAKEVLCTGKHEHCWWWYEYWSTGALLLLLFRVKPADAGSKGLGNGFFLDVLRRLALCGHSLAGYVQACCRL